MALNNVGMYANIFTNDRYLMTCLAMANSIERVVGWFKANSGRSYDDVTMTKAYGPAAVHIVATRATLFIGPWFYPGDSFSITLCNKKTPFYPGKDRFFPGLLGLTIRYRNGHSFCFENVFPVFRAGFCVFAP